MKRRPGRILPSVISSLFKKPATIAYPKGEMQIEPHYRGRIVYDPDDCIGCTLCMKDCPTGAIKIINDGTKEDKHMRAELNVGKCIFCAQCVDSCRRGCLSFSQNIDMARMDKKELVIDPSKN